MADIHQLTNEAYVVGAPSEAALVTFTSPDNKVVEFKSRQGRDIGDINGFSHSFKGRRKGKIKDWGTDNELPNRIDDILCDNNITGELMVTKRDIIAGNGISAYVVVVVDGSRTRIPVDMPVEAEQWIEETKFYTKYYRPAINNLVKLQNNFTEIMPSRDGKTIASVLAREAKHCRLGEKNEDGKLTSVYMCGDWTDHKKTVSALPVYMGKLTNSIYHNGDNFFNDGYYNIPTWMGSIEWIELANAIPKFHQANLSNGYTLRYHIEIPADYFLDFNKWERAGSNEKEQKKCIDAAKKANQDFLDSVNEILSGVNNAGRTIHSTYAIDKLTKQHVGINIKEINTDMKDEALLKLFDKSNQATISSQGIHPTLANIESQGKLSSGSEMRNAFNFWVAVKTRTYRMHVMEIWDMIAQANGWSSLTDQTTGKRVRYHIEDITLAKLDDDKSGTEKPAVKSEKS